MPTAPLPPPYGPTASVEQLVSLLKHPFRPGAVTATEITDLFSDPYTYIDSKKPPGVISRGLSKRQYEHLIGYIGASIKERMSLTPRPTDDKWLYGGVAALAVCRPNYPRTSAYISNDSSSSNYGIPADSLARMLSFLNLLAPSEKSELKTVFELVRDGASAGGYVEIRDAVAELLGGIGF